MIRTLATVFVGLAALVAPMPAPTPAAAAGEDAAAIVSREVEDARSYCADLGTIHEPSFAREVDLDGDGRLDLVLDFDGLRCGSGQPPSCGSGGCMVRAWLATDRGLTEVVRQVGDGYEIGETAQGLVLTVPQRQGYPAEAYRFENGCAVPVGTDGTPSCGLD